MATRSPDSTWRAFQTEPYPPWPILFRILYESTTPIRTLLPFPPPR